MPLGCTRAVPLLATAQAHVRARLPDPAGAIWPSAWASTVHEFGASMLPFLIAKANWAVPPCSGCPGPPGAARCVARIMLSCMQGKSTNLYAIYYDKPD
jgi:hypothetical protein